MKSLERIRCAIRLQAADVTPVAPYMGNHGAHVAGVSIGEYCRSGKLMAEAQYRAWQVYGQDAVVAQSDNYYIAEGFGVEVQHYENSTPTLKAPAVQDLEDVDRLRVPNPWRDGRMPVYLEAIDMISPAMYRKWAWPAERRFFETINPLAEQHGAATLLHICGNMTPVLEVMAETGAQILELDYKVSLKTAKERVGRRVCLMGNLDPVEVLWRAAPESVALAARQAVADAGQDGGFILGSGCEVPMHAPQANLHAMIAAARGTAFHQPQA